MDYTAIQDEEEKRLTREIQEERKLRSSLQWAIEDLERAVIPLEDQLRSLDVSEHAEGNEWAVRYKAQKELNELLGKQYDWLRDEFERKKDLLSEGLTLDARNLDLGRFTEHDLARLQSELERERNHLYGLLRDAEWKLDKRSQELFHLNDLRKVYRAEIQQLDWKLQKLRSTSVLHDIATLSPDLISGSRTPASTTKYRMSRSQSPSRISRQTDSDSTLEKPTDSQKQAISDPRRSQQYGKTAGARTLPTLKKNAQKQETKESSNGRSK